jgi:2',3'-cyclic-nucleotide 2'-phosphodiesterase (5'-nucleotidase family)
MIWSLLLACLHVRNSPEAEQAAGPGTLTILHTNDLHGHFLPERAAWLDGNPKIGGFAALDSWVQATEKERGANNVVVLDGGDLLTGTPLTDIEVRGTMGGAMLEFMELVGYDAWVVGNHEFDKGFANAIKLVAASAIPVLSVNLDNREGGNAMPGLKDSIVIERAGLRIGIIGATTMGLGHLASAATMSRIQLAPLAESVQGELDRLDPDTDLLVLLSHIGLDADRRLAEKVEGLDLIVGGHSHTHLSIPEQVNGTWIVQAGSYGRSMGQVTLSVENDAISSFSGEVVDLVAGVVPDKVRPEMAKLVAYYSNQISDEYGQVISNARATLGRSYHYESDLGNWITDVLREAGKSHIALYNVGGLRADLVEGEVTVGSIYEIFPFGNQVVTFQLTGTEVLGVLLENARTAMEQDHGCIQLSGANMVWRVRMGAPEAVEITIGGEPFDPAATYTVTSNSYVAEQAARYLSGASPKNLKGLEQTVFDVALAAAKAGPIEAPPKGRWVRKQ